MSTAKSMANSYLSGKRQSVNKSNTLLPSNGQQRAFKSSHSNLAMPRPINGQLSSSSNNNNNTKTRLKATSMTNLVASGESSQQQNSPSDNPQGTRIQRPVSRNALDSIHNGMNAKYAQVQSKVYLQNIRPQPATASKIPGGGGSRQEHNKAAGHRSGRSTPGAGGTGTLQNERAALQAKVKALEEELAKGAEERQALRQELEREQADKLEQVQQLKAELQDKLAEHDKQNEEYHQKLLEAYELADQNRRAADSVLSESRQRDEESRKRTEELEAQLNELKEFVAMKEEMTGKMYELREQIRDERQRYEEQLKSLHQVFENEKISHSQNLTSSAVDKNCVDHNSNYFKRTKAPLLQSTESVNKIQATCNPTGEHIESGALPAWRRHQYDQQQQEQQQMNDDEMYGSKLSTRMHDTARSAWRASKQFASSVITGGVGLSACRQCTKRRSSSLSANSMAKSTPGLAMSPGGCGSGDMNVAVPVLLRQQPNETSYLPSSACHELSPAGSAVNLNEQQHTSIVEVGKSSPSSGAAAAASKQQQQQQQPTVSQQAQQSWAQQQSKIDVQRNEPGEGEQQVNSGAQSLIRVDANNKLTIVTKFNDSECPASNLSGASSVDHHHGATSAPPSSGGSERSRCESSSSGRGTSSDAGSAASQNGDCELPDGSGQGNKAGGKQDDSQMVASTGEAAHGKFKLEALNGGKGERRHKRKSSLFKAGKMLSGSQVSLNKLKNFFMGSSKNVNGDEVNLGQQRQHLPAISAPLGRLEFDQQHQAPVTEPPTTTTNTGQALEQAKKESEKSKEQQQQQVGQGEGAGGSGSKLDWEKGDDDGQVTNSVSVASATSVAGDTQQVGTTIKVTSPAPVAIASS